MTSLVMTRAADCGRDVRSLFAKIEQNSLVYYEFEPIDTQADPAPPAAREGGLLRGWRTVEAQPAACAADRLDALFARLGAGSSVQGAV
ncbi:hypothetical protein [Caulobacter sp. NIBR2454]|uniref:hypothetical protein n=1 Tax=Caulobacter sp. NIBR2454 TaxID=3015996 RepID=UPI0022B70FD9|nr:hypothetical protein [Caulobacter sp. NIBR2454]